MRSLVGPLVPVILAPFLLLACSHVEDDRVNASLPTAVQTRIMFEPLDREQAQTYLQSEQHTYKQYTDPMFGRKAALERGRAERYQEVQAEFPECSRQKHCLQDVTRGDVKKFERYNQVIKELHAYDTEIIELDAALRDWKSRLEMRTRAILNRFIVHEVLQLPSVEPRFRGVLVYSLESFETRRQFSRYLMRYAPEADMVPTLLGDYDFRMLGRPVDEAAVLATFEVYLMPSVTDTQIPTRYAITFLVNTHQLDLRFYDKDFLRAWAGKLTEPYQNQLRQEVYCGLYSIAGETLAPRLDLSRPKQCAEQRSYMRGLNAGKFADRFLPDQWMLPLAYSVLRGGETAN